MNLLEFYLNEKCSKKLYCEKCGNPISEACKKKIIEKCVSEGCNEETGEKSVEYDYSQEVCCEKCGNPLSETCKKAVCEAKCNEAGCSEEDDPMNTVIPSNDYSDDEEDDYEDNDDEDDDDYEDEIDEINNKLIF